MQNICVKWMKQNDKIKDVTWQELLELLSWYPVMWSSLCKSSEDRAPVDFIYGCLIFKWIAETWFKDEAPGY